MPSSVLSHPALLKIGVNDSILAHWQAEYTRTELARIGIESEVVIIRIQSDAIQHPGSGTSKSEGVFTKETEGALLRGEIDLAVYSMNDLPTSQPQGLVITAVSHRDNPADWLIIRRESVSEKDLFRLAKNAIVGTDSNLRKAQLADFRPDVRFKDIRDNAPARLGKLRSGDLDAIFITASEVIHLGLDLSELEVVELHPREYVPAPAQGVLAWQTNRDDTDTRLVLQQIHHPEVSAVTNVERSVLKLMGGDSQLPLGVHCQRDASGHFHAYAACEIDGTVRRPQLSSSTSFGMAEKLVAALQNS